MKTKLRRIFRWFLVAVAALVALAFLLQAEENWRGARAWAAAKRDLQAQGESLDPKDFIPPPVPDDQNLAMAPLFARVFEYRVDPISHAPSFRPSTDWHESAAFEEVEEQPWGKNLSKLQAPSGYANWMVGHPTELSVVQRYFRQHPDFPHATQPQAPADDVLLALTRYGPLFDELAQAAGERPQTRFPVDWTRQPAMNIPLPHYIILQKLTQTLRLRASAELAAGQMAAARRDLALGFRLRMGMADDPVLLASLVDMTVAGILIQPVWEGLAAQQWSAEDLDALRSSLRQVNLLRDYRHAVRGERALFLGAWAENLRNQVPAEQNAKNTWALLFRGVPFPPSSPESWRSKLLSGMPRGWYLQNLATACRFEQAYVVDGIEPDHDRVLLNKCKGLAPAVDKLTSLPGDALAKHVLETYDGLTIKFIQTQAIVDQAATACALERYYLDQHAYPAALTALLPTYLDAVPDDVIDGAPLRYCLTADGRYQLWSVGWNGTDEGGTIEWPSDRKYRKPPGATAGTAQPVPRPDRERGDWVWQYAPAEPPDPPANGSRLESLSP